MANVMEHLRDVAVNKYGASESEVEGLDKEQLADLVMRKIAVKRGAAESEVAGQDRNGLVYSLLRLVAIDVLKIKDPSKVTMDTSFADLGADSLDMVELLMGIEDTFADFGDMKIADEDANIATMNQAVEKIGGYVERYLNS